MKAAKEFFEKNATKNLSKINTLLPGVIDRFDASRMVADVVLSTGALITEVRVMALCTNKYYVSLPYEKGDPVLVGFAQEDIDGFIYGDKATPSQKRFRLDDSFVLGGIVLANETVPNQHPGELVLGSRRGAAKITISEHEVHLVGDVFANGQRLGY